jgi:CorA-like Mg2+ transporter protein
MDALAFRAAIVWGLAVHTQRPGLVLGRLFFQPQGRTNVMSDKDPEDHFERLCNELHAIRVELRIIKIFMVAVVVFMAPMLIASIYGMNFKHMPELDYSLGYPLALVLMLFSAIVPYLFFRLMKWIP